MARQAGRPAGVRVGDVAAAVKVAKVCGMRNSSSCSAPLSWACTAAPVFFGVLTDTLEGSPNQSCNLCKVAGKELVQGRVGAWLKGQGRKQ